jgi:glucose uptake protein
LFYWDYAIGVLLLALVLAFTAGSTGTEGRSFLADLGQANGSSLLMAFIGGVIFNLANILLVAAINIAGMAVAFPIGIGLALVLGVLTNYAAAPVGNAALLFSGVFLVVVAIVLDAKAYRKLAGKASLTSAKGIMISLMAGFLMGFFYRFVAGSMAVDFVNPEEGKLTPYTASVIFAIGLLVSNFVWNSVFMYKPLAGEKVTYRDYFTKGRYEASPHRHIGWRHLEPWYDTEHYCCRAGRLCHFIRFGTGSYPDCSTVGCFYLERV